MKKLRIKIISSLLSALLLFNFAAGGVLTYAEEDESWKSYVGNMDAFVYGLLTRQYELFYDVFSAVMVLPDGSEIYGIAYSDYEGVFESEDSSMVYFPAGFLPLIGESPVPSDLSDEGIEIIDAGYDDPDCRFIYSYETTPFMQHCVIWNQYLQYGIDDEGCITYSCEPYQRGYCDEDLGALYSYDENRFVFNPNLGEYVSVNGISLNVDINYQNLEDEINRILKTQDENLWTEEIQSSVYESHEAIASYMLSLQEERFFGYDVRELAQAVSQLDPMECIRITPDGMILVDFEENFWKDSNSLAKWITGTSCVIAIAGCIAVDLLIPELMPVSAAIMGTASEVFMQVVINNQALSDINWNKVAIASATAVVMAWVNPLMAEGVTNVARNGVVNIFGKTIKFAGGEFVGKIAGYGALAMGNSLTTGLSSYLMAMEDGSTHENALNAAFIGAGIACVCTLSLSAISEISRPYIEKFVASHPNNWLVKATNKAGIFIQKQRDNIRRKYTFVKKLERIHVPKSVHQASKAATEEIRLQDKEGKLLKDAIDQLPSDDNKNFIKLDQNGNEVSKEELLKNGGKCVIKLKDGCQQDLVDEFARYDVDSVVVENGIPDLKDFSECSIEIDMLPDRDTNLSKANEKLASMIAEDSPEIPDRIWEALKNRGYSKEGLSTNQVGELLSDAHLIRHEGTDNMVYLIDDVVHEKFSHFGGRALVERMIGINEIRVNLEKIIAYKFPYNTPNMIFGTYVGEVVY